MPIPEADLRDITMPGNKSMSPRLALARWTPNAKVPLINSPCCYCNRFSVAVRLDVLRFAEVSVL